MRVFQLISSGGFYGAESVVLTLSKAVHDMGHSNTLGVFYDARNPHTELVDLARASGLAVEVIPCRRRWDWEAVRAIRAHLREQSVDILHTHGYKADFYGFIAARGTRAALVATSHYWTRRTLGLRLFASLDHAVLKRFDAVGAVSDAIAASLIRSGAKKERIRTIDNGIDLFPFECAASTLAKEIGKGDRPIVGAVGRLVSQKGFSQLLHAAKGVVSDFPAVLFVLVGEGPERAMLEGLTKDLGLQDNVLLAGRRNDMPGVYASFDAFVLPSLDEGMPIALLEALAAGKPVVATRVAAVPKIIVPESTGLLVEPGDISSLRAAISRLLADANLRQQLGRQGHAWVKERFSSEAMAAQYLDLYQEVAGEGTRLEDRELSAPSPGFDF